MAGTHSIRSMPQLGAEIRRARSALGLTQAELAARVDVRQATISDLETGRSGVRVDTLLEVLAALRLQLAFEPREGGGPAMGDLF